jgi:hypothetical protein
MAGNRDYLDDMEMPEAPRKKKPGAGIMLAVGAPRSGDKGETEEDSSEEMDDTEDMDDMFDDEEGVDAGPLADASDEELLAEMKKRGISSEMPASDDAEAE